jgi:hypothetical protein
MSEADRLIAVIADQLQDWPAEDADVHVEFYEPARDWLALLAEIARRRPCREGDAMSDIYVNGERLDVVSAEITMHHVMSDGSLVPPHGACPVCARVPLVGAVVCEHGVSLPPQADHA